MPKPKSELLEVESICGVIHAKGAILALNEEINYHLSEIEPLRVELVKQANFKPFQGLSPQTIKQLADDIGGHFWCVEQYRATINAINDKFFNTNE